MFVRILWRLMVAALVLGAQMQAPNGAARAQSSVIQLAEAAPGAGCLSRRDMIAAVKSGRAKPLSEIRDMAERAGGGELINAELCEQGGKLIYDLTILSENGRMTKVTVDAAAGRLSGVR